MNPKNDGGPAFPVPKQISSSRIEFPDYDLVFKEGLTIRDYFAAKAMSGWLASFDPDDGMPSKEVGQKQIAEMAYSIADAMLAERNK